MRAQEKVVPQLSETAAPYINDGGLGQAYKKLTEQEERSRLLIHNQPSFIDGGAVGGSEPIRSLLTGQNLSSSTNVDEEVNTSSRNVDEEADQNSSSIKVDEDNVEIDSNDLNIQSTREKLGDDREITPVDASENQNLAQKVNSIKSSQKSVKQVKIYVPRSRTHSGRITKLSKRWAMLTIQDDLTIEPKSYHEAVSRSDAKQWKQAIEDELQSHEKNKSFMITELPKDARALACKWVFKIKPSTDSRNKAAVKYKARLVIRGDLQPGTDLETYAPVAKLTTYRILMTVVAMLNLELHQMDVKTAFLFASLDQIIYMELPTGYNRNIPSKLKNPVLKLNKALYGLKQAPRAWNVDIDKYLRSIGFLPTTEDESLYINRELNAIILLYVDDLLIAALNITIINDIKEKLKSKYAMTDLGEAKSFLGIYIERDRQNLSIRLHQSTMIEGILRRYEMHNCNPSHTPLNNTLSWTSDNTQSLSSVGTNWYQQLVGQYMYLMVSTRPDLAFTVGRLSKFMASPTEEHGIAAKSVLRYLQKTKTMGLLLGGNATTPLTLKGYSDADWAGDLDDRKSTGGHMFFLNESLIQWKSKKQTIVTDGTWHSEYIAASEAAKEALWLKRLLISMKLKISTPQLYIDNTAAEQLAVNPKSHNRTKHVDVKYHLIRDQVNRKEITIHRVSSEDNTADILTKALSKVKHWKHVTDMHMR
ncbi:uncharacterized protein DFL_005791 [Arthrobotrys flagrans]|uniref:Reverse transcriptase Ty1/copia-type domain-containing protein n=1 Tax=Arthrobotrys flagrans TaxID=97331 RepID=A0A436ZZ74_ARTFL|nr:hypothetical protein DFL_005791 [Arthrobotrys flagrans]